MAYETMVTVMGNAATAVEHQQTADGQPVARFRLASTVRYWDREKGAWADGHTNYFTVWARRALAANLRESLAVGEPVIVQGRLRVREGEWGGQRRMSADIDALTVGHDLSRGTAAFHRVSQARQLMVPAPVPGSAPGSAPASVAGSVPLSAPASGS